MRKKSILTIFSILMAISCEGNSSVVITNSDSVDNASLVTVTGSGFGTKTAPAPLKFETFEKKSETEVTVVGNPVPSELSYWTGRGGTTADGRSKDLTITDTQKRHSGSSRAAAAYLAVTNGTSTNAQQIWHNSVGFSSTGKVYVNMWIRWSWVANPTYLTEYTYYQIKSFNLSTSHEPNGDPVRPYITEFVGFMYDTPHYAGYTQSYHRNGRVTHSDQSFYYNNSTIPGNYSGWVNVVLISNTGTNKNDASSTDGWRTIQISAPNFDGVYQQKSESGMNYLDDETKGTHPIDSIKIGWFLGANLLNGNTTLYYDDIYMDNTFARVEIGNNSVYANCTHREIQLPTEWSDTTIKFNTNVAGFSSSDELYLYIIDSDGNISPSYKVRTAIRGKLISGNSSVSSGGTLKIQ